MVLTLGDQTRKDIVHGAVPAGERPTTYDATVGSIIRCGVEIKQTSFILPPRHIIWVVSAESFEMGDTTTGLATLKTQWTHQGVLALNVGIIDPGWNGPVAAAVVNFSSSDFVIEKGTPFFRILFIEHPPIPAAELKPVTFRRADYVRQITGYSRAFSSTFLDMDDLSRTVADKVLGMPRWGLILSLVAIAIALLAISIPVGFTIWLDATGDKTKIATIEGKVSQLEAATRSGQIDTSECTLAKIHNQSRLICPPR